jgi:hypothetical protein
MKDLWLALVGMSVAAISCSNPVISPVPACYFAVIFDRSAGFMRLSDEFAFRAPVYRDLQVGQMWGAPLD